MAECQTNRSNHGVDPLPAIIGLLGKPTISNLDVATLLLLNAVDHIGQNVPTSSAMAMMTLGRVVSSHRLGPYVMEAGVLET